MSALTERKKKEIETQYREMVAKRARKVFLTVFCNVRSLQDTLAIPQKIMDSIRKIRGVESVSHTNGTNVITVIAQWQDHKVTIKNPDLKDAVVSKMKAQKILPYSVKKLGQDKPDPKYITCMSLFPNLDAATVITLLRDRMNSILSIHGVKQVDILHAAKKEEAEDGQNKDVFIIHGRDEKNAFRLKEILKNWKLNGIMLKLRP